MHVPSDFDLSRCFSILEVTTKRKQTNKHEVNSSEQHLLSNTYVLLQKELFVVIFFLLSI